MSGIETLQLAHISIHGVVQGVGFRPFVYKLAAKHNLKGWTCNTSEGIRIEVEGKTRNIKQFFLELRTAAPPLAHIEDTTIDYSTPVGYRNFEIRHSIANEGKYQLVSPDIATCQNCLTELLDPTNRRYRYPFTNCTNCGPRFTIIASMPYDRPRTTMHSFHMCPQCLAEYDNPADRRFHAQPNACPKCGPQISLVDNKGRIVNAPDPIAAASQFLKEGEIIAAKSLGGFLLACDATNTTAVSTLRTRKKRPSKPFAIMVINTKEARRYCYVSPEEEKLLVSPQSPIVLMRWRENSPLAQQVAPNLRYLGIMLPYTPLHHILLRDAGVPLVMTSGNLSEEPIAKDNDEALRKLSGIADHFLVHNRDICSRYDDSVAIVESGAARLLRRARGYAPYPIHLTFKSKQILGCGADMKNTFCLTRDSHAFLSQHIGDMETVETLEHFDSTISLYKRLFSVEPEIIACDRHPDYLSTKYAEALGECGIRLIPVQHHHAHIVSCMVDNNVASPVIGVAFDGTGLGHDGFIWGGEFLVADYRGFNRVGHLEYLPLPGGDTAIKKPYRIAIGYILSLLGEDALMGLTQGKQVSPLEIETIKLQIARKLNSPLTSSMGRFFDAVSALIGIRDAIDYEGQAAVELEMVVYNHRSNKDAVGTYPYQIAEDRGISIVKLNGVLSSIIEDLNQGVSQGEISLKFHNSVAQMTGDMCQLIARETGIKQVALSGGVFQNRLLLRKTTSLLEREGFHVLTHKQVPCNDEGISLGQAIIANFSE